MRTRTILCAMLTAALMLGCGPDSKWGKKKAAKEQEKQQQARQDKQSSDPFEKSGDPPLNANTRFAAGQLAEAQGDIERALLQYREAIKLDENYQNAIFRLGALLTRQKRYTEAVQAWQHYIKATKGAPAAYNNLAFCYEQAGRLRDAEETFKAGIERDPDASTCRVNYGLMLARHDRLDDAVAQLRMSLSPAEVQYNLGSVFEQMGRREQARAYYQKALELDPRLSDAQSRLAALK